MKSFFIRLFFVFTLACSFSCEAQGILNPYSFGTSLDNTTNTTADGKQVIAIAGNSIALGHSELTAYRGAINTFPSGTVNQWWQGSVQNLGYNDLSSSIYSSPWMKLGIDWYRKTGRKPVFVNRAKGGSTFYPVASLGNNNWSSTGSNRAIFKAAVDSALANLSLTSPRAIFVELGINDARNSESLASIQTEITTFVNWLNSIYPNTRIYFINIGREEVTGEGSRVTAIQGYIGALPGTFSNVKIAYELHDFVTSDNKYFPDLLHPSTFATDLLGKLCVDSLITQGELTNTPITYSFSSDATTVFARYSSLSDQEKISIAKVVDEEVAQGDWADLDEIWFHCLTTEANSLVGAKGLVNMTNNGATFTAHYGFGFGTTSKYLSTGYTPSSNGANWTLNNAAVGGFIRNNRQATGTTAVLIGAVGSTSAKQVLLAQGSTGGILYRTNSANGGTWGAETIFKQNYSYTSIRTASNAAALYRSGFSSDTNTGASGTEVDVNILVGCRNNNGSRDFPIDIDLGATWVGNSSINFDYLSRLVRELVIDQMTRP